ncbi:hypothetical protein U0070_015227 [Myodes glareolus]|uniref:Uncharacterized protein n=1 Tax=Myodes glareolus TaxID=447135 RepID=A0AAW0JZU9_MYOGA
MLLPRNESNTQHSYPQNLTFPLGLLNPTIQKPCDLKSSRRNPGKGTYLWTRAIRKAG